MSRPVQVNAVVKIFYNRQDRSFYVQIEGKLFRVSDKVATAIQEEINVDIRHGNGVKDIQLISQNDPK